MDKCPVVVIDSGAEHVRVGHGGTIQPFGVRRNYAYRLPHNFTSLSQPMSISSTSPSSLSMLKENVVEHFTTKQRGPSEWIVGDHQEDVASTRTHINSICYPMLDLTRAEYRRPFDQQGHLVDLDLEGSIWRTGLTEKVEPNAYSLILSSHPLLTAKEKEDIAELVFERMGFASLCRASTAELGLRGYQYEIQQLVGEVCACIVDLGHSYTTIIPMHHLKPIKSAVKMLSIGGRDLTRWLQQHLINKTPDLILAEHVVAHMKRIATFVSNDYRRDLQRFKAHELHVLYHWPDYTAKRSGYTESLASGNKLTNITSSHQIVLGSERMTTSELYFKPALMSLNQLSLPYMIHDAIKSCPIMFQPLLYQNILLVGGGALIPGLCERVEIEVRMLAPYDMVVKIAKSSDPLYTIWVGGSCLSQDVKQLPNMLVHSKEWRESGLQAVLRKE